MMLLGLTSQALHGTSRRFSIEEDPTSLCTMADVTRKTPYSIDYEMLLEFSDSESSGNVTTDDEELILSPSRSLRQRSLTNKTIILDMDLTLICTIGDGSDLSHRMRTNHRTAYDSLERKGILVPTTLTHFGGSGRAVHNDVVKRPGVDEFLIFCRTVFKHVILWSAGQASYVYDIVRLVLDPENKGVFDHVYTAQDIVQCTFDNEQCMRTDESLLFANTLRAAGFSNFSTKPIEKLQSEYPDVTLDKTIIVDDLQCNFLPNPRNGVLIPPFSPGLSQMLTSANSGPLDNMSDDYCLFSLLHFLADDAFLKAADVREYNLQFFPDTQGTVPRKRA